MPDRPCVGALDGTTATGQSSLYVRGVTAMGRGRQKAKQTKVARELKYYTPPTDIRALEQELSRRSTTDVVDHQRSAPEDEADPYVDWNDERD